MRFHREGYVSLVLILILSVFLVIFALSTKNLILQSLLILISVFLLAMILQFFRNPKREVPEAGKNLIYTPADGKVVVIEKTVEPEYLKTECWLVSVFMSPLNVHVNRNPVDATVSYVKYHKGKYLVAWHPKSSELNERFTTAYTLASGQKIVVKQIAGAMARRIVNYLEPGQSVSQGHEMGFIKFGSRADIYLPIEARIKVQLNQTVSSPIDLIAEL